MSYMNHRNTVCTANNRIGLHLRIHHQQAAVSFLPGLIHKSLPQITEMDGIEDQFCMERHIPSSLNMSKYFHIPLNA